jgi:hypothetical protein
MPLCSTGQHTTLVVGAHREQSPHQVRRPLSLGYRPVELLHLGHERLDVQLAQIPQAFMAERRLEVQSDGFLVRRERVWLEFEFLTAEPGIQVRANQQRAVPRWSSSADPGKLGRQFLLGLLLAGEGTDLWLTPLAPGTGRCVDAQQQPTVATSAADTGAARRSAVSGARCGSR